MKRVIGRKLIEDMSIYYNYKVPTVNFDLLDANAVHFRFRWTIDVIQNMRASGIITRRALDIGANDGTLAALIARMPIDPGVPGSSPKVDALESYAPAVAACETLSKTMGERGFTMNVCDTTIEDFKPDHMYDVITAFEVLEHTTDPLFCLEKMYDMLEIGGHIFLSVPEEHGMFGLTDNNPMHYWTATAQSLVSTMFYDDRKWNIKQMFNENGLLHILVKKMTYMA